MNNKRFWKSVSRAFYENNYFIIRLILVFLVLFFLCIPIFSYNFRGIFFDEGMWLINGQVIKNGEKLYVYAFDHKPPLINIIYSCFSRIASLKFNETKEYAVFYLTLERLTSVLFNFSCFLIYASIMRKIYKLDYVLIYISILLIISYPVFIERSLFFDNNFYMAFFGTLALLLMQKYNIQPVKYGILSGLFLSLSFSFKQTGFVFILIGFIFLISTVIFNSVNRKSVIKFAIIFTIVLGLGVIFNLLLISKFSEFRTAFYYLFQFNTKIGAPYPNTLDKIFHFVWYRILIATKSFYTSSITYLLTFSIIIIFGKSKNLKRIFNHYILFFISILVFVPISLFLKEYSNQYLLPVIILMSILMVLALKYSHLRIGYSLKSNIFIVCFIISVLINIYISINKSIVKYSLNNQIVIANKVKLLTKPTDYILSADPTYTFLSGRKTFYLTSIPHTYAQAEGTSDLMRTFLKSKVKLIITAENPSGSAPDRIYDKEFIEYFREKYKLVEYIDNDISIFISPY